MRRVTKRAAGLTLSVLLVASGLQIVVSASAGAHAKLRTDGTRPTQQQPALLPQSAPSSAVMFPNKTETPIGKPRHAARHIRLRGQAIQESFPKPTGGTGATVVPASLTSGTNLNIFPGAVSTFATNSAFTTMGGSVTVGNLDYIATSGAILQVNLTTGAVSTFAGPANAQTGCQVSSNPSSDRFSATPGGMDTDGTYLYLADYGCNDIVKITIATGATVLVTSLANVSAVTIASDGFLYASILTTSTYSSVQKIDPATGVATGFGSFALTGMNSITSDSQNVWVTYDGQGLAQFPLAGGNGYTYAGPKNGNVSGSGQLISAGSYLYVPGPGNTSLERLTKPAVAGGTLYVDVVAGTPSSGNVDGTGTDAWFANLTSLASDGTNLWAGDQGNHTLRKVVAASPLPSAQPASATSTTDLFPAKVTTQGTNAALAGAVSSVLVNGWDYVVVPGAVLKVDPATGGSSVWAGVAGTGGCQSSSSGSGARFSTSPGEIDTDGYYLYLADFGCGAVDRISLATGATSVVAPVANVRSLTVGPDKMIYAAVFTGLGSSILQIDRINGVVTPFAPPGSPSFDSVYSITSDANYVWLTPFSAQNIFGVPFAGGNVIAYAGPNNGVHTAGSGQLVSAGKYLYVSTYGNTGIERITKATGAIGQIAGNGTSGSTDGEWSFAQFANAGAVSTNGTSLWVVDASGGRLTKLAYAPLRAQELGPAGSSDAAAPRAMQGDPVDTSSGNFTWHETDATLPGIGSDFAFTRYYNSMPARPGRFGNEGWLDSFDAVLDPQGNGDVHVFMPDGQSLTFTGANLTPSPGTSDVLSLTSGNYYLRRPDGTIYQFDHSGVLQSITNRLNKSFGLTYDASGRLVKVTDTAGRFITLGYAGTDTKLQTLTMPDSRYVTYTYTNGVLTGVSDLNHVSRSYAYAGNQLSLIYDGNGQLRVQNVYDPGSGRVTAQVDPNGQSSYSYGGQAVFTPDVSKPTEYYVDSYAADGTLLSQTDPAGNLTQYTNYQNARPGTIIRPGGQTWQYVYNATGAPTSITTPIASDGPLTYEYANVSFPGAPTKVTDARGKVYRFEYDAQGNPQCEILPTTSTTTCSATAPKDKIVFAYDPVTNLLTGVTDQNGHTTTYAYYPSGDAKFGLLKSVSTPLGLRTSYDYDANLHLRTVVTPQGNAVTNNCQTSCAAYTWTYTYDSLGQLKQIQDPLGNPATAYNYDGGGNLQSVTDPSGKVTSYAYYSGGRVCDVYVGSTAALCPGQAPAGSTSYTYDARGHVASITDPNGNATGFTYWPTGQLHTTTDAMAHVTSFAQPSFTSSGSTATETLPSNDVITDTFDARGRITSASYSTPTDPTLTSTPSVGFGYDANGNRCWAVSPKPSGSYTCAAPPSGATSYTFDAMNRLQSAGGFSYIYDDAGNLTRRTYPDTTKISYGYDNDNRLCAFAIKAATVTCASGGTTTFDYSGLLTATAQIVKTFPGGTTTTSLDAAGRTTKVTNKAGSAIVSRSTYTLYPNGDPQSIAVTNNGFSGANPAVETQSYIYDASDRLSQVCYDASGSSACTSSGSAVLGGITKLNYTYDGAGDILTKQVSGTTPSTTTYAYTPDEQICWSYAGTSANGCLSPPGGATSYAYNINGDRTTAGTSTYTYDLAGRLRVVKSGSTTQDNFTYDPLGNRAADSTTSGAFTWDINSSVPELVTDTSGDYLYGAGLEALKSGTSTFYFDEDRMGSVLNLVNSSGTAQRTYAYEPYGTRRAVQNVSGAQVNPMSFDGEYRDSTTGQYDLRARQYDPGTGGFLTADPASRNPRYRFAASNPASYSDPSGRLSWKKVLAVAVGAALVVGGIACLVAEPCGAVEAVAGAGTVAAEAGTSAAATSVAVSSVAVGGAILCEEECETVFDTAAGLADIADVTSGEGASVFYSGPGGLESAQEWAGTNGGVLLQDTLGGGWFNNQAPLVEQGLTAGESEEVWGMLSTRFAEQGSETVHVFLGSSVSSTSIWALYELPALEARGATIIYH